MVSMGFLQSPAEHSPGTHRSTCGNWSPSHRQLEDAQTQTHICQQTRVTVKIVKTSIIIKMEVFQVGWQLLPCVFSVSSTDTNTIIIVYPKEVFGAFSYHTAEFNKTQLSIPHLLIHSHAIEKEELNSGTQTGTSNIR